MTVAGTISRRVSMLRGASVAFAVALALSGCASRGMTTGSVNRGKPLDQMNESEMAGAVSRLGARYAKDPSDKDSALAYADALRMSGRDEQALAVMRKTAIGHPKDRKVLAAYGKALAAAGEFEAALDAVRRAQTPEYPDWKLLSAEGAILDQIGQTAEARALYQKALDMRPGEASVLSNLGMSHLLSGDLPTAEDYLRRASQSQGADSRVRQNLALAVGLQGRFDEAEAIARGELSQGQAEANVAYLRQMLAQQNSWNQLADKKKSGG